MLKASLSDEFEIADVAFRSRRFSEAAEHYRFLASSKDPSRAYVGLSASFLELGDLISAEIAARQALDTEPLSASAHFAQAKASLALGNNTQSLASFRRAVSIRRAASRALVQVFSVPAHFALHNLEQAEFLSRTPDPIPEFAELDSVQFQPLIARLREMISNTGKSPPWIKVSGANGHLLYDPAYVYLDAEAPECCINSGLNFSMIENEYFSAEAHVAIVDNFLSSDALVRMIDFCHHSTVWRHPYKFGYIGAFPEDGFVNATLLRLISELYVAFPNILSGTLPTQWWCFAYDASLPGTDVHADDADVTVNLWLAPDSANRNPETGGLVVWNRRSPSDWSFDQMNSGGNAIRDYIRDTEGCSHCVPHRQNRAVLFDGHLFHETDRASFRGGFENRRRNLTILFRRF